MEFTVCTCELQTSPLDIQDWHPSDWHLSPWGLLRHQSSRDARGEPRLAAHQDIGRAPRSQPGRRFQTSSPQSSLRKRIQRQMWGSSGGPGARMQMIFPGFGETRSPREEDSPHFLVSVFSFF